MLRTLCLSGGGFRASLYHLGVISALREFNLLGDIREITSVSGGSILAAHLVLNWEKYNSKSADDFREIASEFVAFVQADIRGRLIRRWLLLGWLKRYQRVNQLIRAYNDFYKGAMLENLEGTTRPNLSILATSLINGDVCTFTRRGVRPNCLNAEASSIVAVPHLRVAVAVAASSAFPPLFPPVVLDGKILGLIGKEMPSGEILSDGGVIDNLGVASLPRASQGKIFISDASAGFKISPKARYNLIINRTVRTTDVLMSRIAYLEKEKLGPDVLIAAISEIVQPDVLPDHLRQGSAMQATVNFVRTDLDKFSDVEVDTIYQHGYEVAAATMLSAVNKERERKVLPIQQLQLLGIKKSEWKLRAQVRWVPSTHKRESSDLFDRMTEIVKRISAGAATDSGVQKSDPMKLAEMELAGMRKLRIWDPHDPFCMVVAVTLLSFVIFVSVVIIYHA